MNTPLELLTDKRNLDFISNMKKILGDNFYNPSFSNLLGFTIQGDYLQFKSYYELKDVPTTEQLLTCLPEADSFLKEAVLWDRSLKSSLALGLKIDENSIVQYFHVKYGKNSPEVKHLPFISVLEDKKLLGGISYEYKNGVVEKKNYLYVTNKNDMKKLLIIKRIDADAEKLEQIECYYTDDDFKINLVYDQPTDAKIDPIISKLDRKTIDRYKSVLLFLIGCDKPIWYVGVTNSKKLSVYFTVTRDKDFVTNQL